MTLQHHAREECQWNGIIQRVASACCNNADAEVSQSPDNLEKGSAQQQNRKRVLFNLGVERVQKLVDDLKRVSEVTGRASSAAAVRGRRGGEVRGRRVHDDGAAPDFGERAGGLFTHVDGAQHLLEELARLGQIVLDAALHVLRGDTHERAKKA